MSYKAIFKQALYKEALTNRSTNRSTHCPTSYSFNSPISDSMNNGISRTIFCLCLVLLCSVDAMAAFDLEGAVKAVMDPVKKSVDDYYPIAIFTSGAVGALMQQQGDLRDRMIGFGKGALIGGLAVLGVKTGLGVA